MGFACIGWYLVGIPIGSLTIRYYNYTDPKKMTRCHRWLVILAICFSIILIIFDLIWMALGIIFNFLNLKWSFRR